MDKVTNITVTTTDGKSYPCRVTLGAMRRFKQETGKDAEVIGSACDLAVFIWCCCASACNADGVAFGVALDDFCDRLELSAARAFSEALGGAEKKTAE